MKHNKQSGFTLIELLVVIAIIGILSAVVLASLNDARKNAKDSAIKQQMKQLVTTAELSRNTTGSYSNLNLGWFDLSSVNCAAQAFTGPQAANLKKICQGIESNIGHEGWFNAGGYMIWGVDDPVTYPPSKNYGIAVFLNSKEWYCVGSSGRNSMSSYAFHPWSGAGCPGNP